jgi:hypothetical protein
MALFRSSIIIFICTFFFLGKGQAQSKLSPVHVGVYHSGITGQIGIGTDLEKRYFGELRLMASDVLDYPFGFEGYLNRNLKKDDWYNFHVGFSLGYFFNDAVRMGLPIGLTLKPIQSNRNFGILMEAMPNYFFRSDNFNLRANIGLRYSFGKN